MKNLFLIVISCLLSLLQLSAQNTIFVGEKNYPCTPTFTLKSDASYGGKDIKVLIAKNGSTGMIILSTDVNTPVRIKGKILLYLDDNTVITCFDYGKFDVVNNIATTIYYLTKDEIYDLMYSNLNSIRFSLKCTSCITSSEEADYTASNIGIKSSYSIIGNTPKTNVPELIEILFEDLYLASQKQAQHEADSIEEAYNNYISQKSKIKVSKDYSSSNGIKPKISFDNGYKSIIIGEQTWMAYNFIDAATKSYCYSEKYSNCYNNGRLYTYEAALKACPKGWHIPSDAEWETLIQSLGGWEVAGGFLKDENLGYNFKLSGYRDENGVYMDIGKYGGYWTSTEHTTYENMVYIKFINSDNTNLTQDYYSKQSAFCVRYIKD